VIVVRRRGKSIANDISVNAVCLRTGEVPLNLGHFEPRFVS